MMLREAFGSPSRWMHFSEPNDATADELTMGLNAIIDGRWMMIMQCTFVSMKLMQ